MKLKKETKKKLSALAETNHSRLKRKQLLYCTAHALSKEVMKVKKSAAHWRELD